MLETKLKYGVKDKEQICSLPYYFSYLLFTFNVFDNIKYIGFTNSF